LALKGNFAPNATGFPFQMSFKQNSAIFPLLLPKMIVVPLSNLRRFQGKFSAIWQH
jgi:hypothetical protein